METPDTLPNNAPFTLEETSVEALSNCVTPSVPPTVPMLRLMSCEARPEAADHGMLTSIEPVGVVEVDPVGCTFASEPSLLNVIVPAAISGVGGVPLFRLLTS